MQTRKRLRSGVLLLTTLIAAGVWGLSRAGALAWLENRTSDARVRFTTVPPGDRDIVIIDIDNASFRTLTDKLGRWPWTRRVWTELIRYLTPGGPRLILFDALFSGAEKDADAAFAAALRAAGNVVLPFGFVAGKIDTSEDIFTPPCSAAVQLAGAPRGENRTRREFSVNAPNKLLEAAIAGAGSNIWNPDPDGVTRRLPLAVLYEQKAWATVWLQAAFRLLGAAPIEYRGSEFLSGAIRLPVDDQGNYVLKWRGDSLTAYKLVPLWEMICSIWPSQCEDSVPRHPASEFRNKIVFVGATAYGSYEVRPTPVSETAPGVFILATAVDNLLHNQAIRPAPEWLNLLLIIALAALPAESVLGHRSITVPVAVLAAVLAAYTGLCFYLYGHASYWLPMSAPMIAAAASFSGNTAYRYFTVDREVAKTRSTLERYVSPQLVSYVLDHIGDFNFKGEKKKLTIFFSDVRSFTTLTEGSDPVDLLNQLNEYLEAMTDIIFKYDGIVDKFIGDGIMAHWGAFTPDRPNALLAAKASLEMFQKLAELNGKWKADGRPPLDFGVGLNTAEVIFGNVGTGKKIDFTAIGDGVNLASRLESSNKEYKTHIIISAATRAELGETAIVRPLGSVVVKGKTIGVEIFELQGLKDSLPLRA